MLDIILLQEQIMTVMKKVYAIEQILIKRGLIDKDKLYEVIKHLDSLEEEYIRTGDKSILRGKDWEGK